MRIIGGTARGRTLVAPPGLDTRPTRDAVRESLFNILRSATEDATVLDLFAGSGALALESVSRGARRAALVDRAPAAIRVIRRNAEHADFSGQCQFLCCDWRTALARLAGAGEAFDLVFLDPPYDAVDLSAVCGALEEAGLLAANALIVAEHRTGAPPRVSPPLREADIRRYGGTSVTIIRREEEPDAHRDLSGQL
jgi:16S rRNA (guanine966-N2)-methyltransferase